MQIEQILAKDIDRNLDGVVKASNFAQLKTEVDEYVVTDEVAKHLTDLLEAYTHPGDPVSNGVWIAGFFGSGKSHLLKMLAHLLGDVEHSGIDRSEIVKSFVGKFPPDNAFLKGALERSAAVPARSLLFNIDEKVDKHEKEQADALLKVFVQVFYDACGYFGKTPYIARFERDLSEKGVYDDFRRAFESHYGQPWEKGREMAVLAESSATAAYAEVTGTTLDRPLQSYRDHYTMSIEGFADEVAAWLGTQATGTRLNFYVDEIGQFIGQDTKLMLSLQTITETLFTRCQGRAWVAVTSQEDMDSIIGDRSRQQQNDFSKIQARFKIQLKLDSKNVREVVSKRLLEKTPAGVTELDRVYGANRDRFRSLFALPDRSYQNYSTADGFVDTYPFVDYQFELFHTAMKGLSNYNAFTGRHASVGERSLLGVTQEIGSAIKLSDVGALATFDMFFDGIEKAVLSAVKHNVNVATQNLEGADAPLAVKVLKALLMTKYIDQFDTTPQSLTVLLTPSIDTNVAALRDAVERALQMLVANTYVQRTGSSYNYLTNEEQDVEKAIKAVERNDSAIKKLLNEEIVKASGVGGKVRHDATGFDLGLERFLDGERQGRSEELSINFVTPLGGYELDEVKFQSLGKAGAVFAVLDLDQRTLDEIDLLVRTREYTQLQLTSQLSESRRRILDSQQRYNSERQRAVMKALNESVRDAVLLHNGTQLTVSGATAKDRVHAALQVAIESRYTRIGEAQAVSGYKDNDLARVLRDDQTLELDVQSALDTLANAIVVALRQAKARGVTIYVSGLVEDFGKPTFGWSMTAVLVAIAHGVKVNRLRLQLNTRVLPKSEVPADLRSTSNHRHTVVEEIREQDPAKVLKLRGFLTDYLDTSEAPNTGDGLVQALRKVLADNLSEVQGWKALPYPLDQDIERATTTIRAAAEGHGDDWYLDGFLDSTDDLLDLKEDVLDPVRAFLKSPSQTQIVGDARSFVDRRGSELNPDDARDLRALLDSPRFFRGNNVPQIKKSHNTLTMKVDEAVDADRVEIRNVVEQTIAELRSDHVFLKASTQAQEQALSTLGSVLAVVDTKSSRGDLALVRSNLDVQYQQVVEVLIQSASKPAKPIDEGEDDPAPGPEAKAATLRLTALSIADAPRTLSTTADIDKYVGALRAALLVAINEGKTVIR